MKEVYYRNVFLDTELNSIGGGQASRVTFPSSEFSVKSSQLMKLTLTSMEIRRNWYSLNKYNNTFFLYNFPALGQYTKFTIKPSSYRTFPDLATGIQDAIQAVPALAASTCVWEPLVRKFKITLAGALATSYFVCFQVAGNNPPPPTGVSADGDEYFNDSTEILGGKRTSAGWDGVTPNNAFVNANTVDAPAQTGNGDHFSKYVGALNSIEAIYLRSGIQNNNFQSLSFEGGSGSNPQSALVSTSIFARIPISRATYDDVFEIIQYEDYNDNFSMLLQQQHLSEMTFLLTDHAGRPLAEVAQGQSADGNLSFKISFRWAIVEQEVPQGEYRVRPPASESMGIKQSYQSAV
jgi:hypothetical protein